MSLTLEQLKKVHYGWFRRGDYSQRLATVLIARREWNLLISMPKGSGRSFCYQLAAATQHDRVTIVFIPDTSGIERKEQYLNYLHAEVACLAKDTTSKNLDHIQYDMIQASPLRTRILYVNIEDAKTDYFKEIFEHVISSNKLAYMVVEKSHYISSRSSMFNPDLIPVLMSLRERTNTIPWVMLTYTDNSEILNDISAMLSLMLPVKKIWKPCMRTNMHYDMVFVLERKYDHLAKFIRRNFRSSNSWYGCGIIYCMTKSNAKDLTEELKEREFDVQLLSEDLPLEEKLDLIEDLGKRKRQIVVTYLEFGKVFGKAKIRFVVHWGIPPKFKFNYFDTSGIVTLGYEPTWCRVYYLPSNEKEFDGIVMHAMDIASKCRDKQKSKYVYCMYLRWWRFLYDKQDETCFDVVETFKRNLRTCHTCSDNLDWDEFMSIVYKARNEIRKKNDLTNAVRQRSEVQSDAGQDYVMSVKVKIRDSPDNDALDEPLVQSDNQTSSNSSEPAGKKRKLER